MVLSLFEQDELEDSKESFLNAQNTVCTSSPPILQAKETEGTVTLLFQGRVQKRWQNEHKKKEIHHFQARLSDVSFATFEEANCWHAKRAYAEKLLAERLPPVDHAPKPIPVGKFFVCDILWNANTPISRIKIFVFCTFTFFFFPTSNMY